MKIKSTVLAGFTIMGSLFVGATFGGMADNSLANTFHPTPMEAEASETSHTTPYELMTTREVLSQTYPLVSSFEVLGYDDNLGVYNVRDIKDGQKETLALEGTYDPGEILIVLWANDGSGEISGVSVLDEKASDLNSRYFKGNLTTSK